MIKLIIFDLDDTLYNEIDFVYDGFMEVAIYLGEKYGVNYYTLYKEMVDTLKNQGRGKNFNIICEKHGFKEDIKNLVRIYRNCSPKINLYDDAFETLENIKDIYKLGLITDGYNVVQWNKIKALGIEKYMDKIIVTDDYGKDYWKPSIKPFQMMLEYFNIKPEEAVYIGDNPNKDFLPCKELGINSIRIIRPIGDHMNTFLDNKHEADLNIKSLLELEDTLEEIK